MKNKPEKSGLEKMVRGSGIFHSVRFKLISSAILIEVIMLSLLVWNSTRLMQQYLLDQMEYRVAELQPLLNASLSGPLLQEDVATIQELMQQYHSDEIKYYAIFNVANQKVVSNGKSVITDKLHNTTTALQRFNQIQGDTYLLHMPITVFKRNVGYLDLEIDMGFISQALMTVRRQGIGIALAEILLSVLLLSIIGIALTRHMRDLTFAAQRMADGDMSVRTDIDTNDEIGETSRTFNRMADNIEASQRTLREREQHIRRLNEDLEQRVAERTEELQEINIQLRQSLEQLGMAQEQLVESEKMAALGSLVAGVAHEINTPLGLGVTTASYLESKVEEFQRIYRQDGLTRSDFEKHQNSVLKSTRIISSNLKRAADLIRSFKQVAVDQISEEIRYFNVCEYLDEIMQSLQPKIKHLSHSVRINCPDSLSIYSYPGAFAQIITNLIVNSFEHGFDDPGKGRIELDANRQGDYLCLQYKDNGKGLDEEGLKKIFDPFFTTRRGQGGSGLGMHIVYNLVTQTFAGQIKCESTPGMGVTFNIKLRMLQERSPEKDTFQ